MSIGELKDLPGYIGKHTQDRAQGALVNGTRVRKIRSDSSDTHKDGALATILGSMGLPDKKLCVYFVEWDDVPGYAVAIAGYRIEAVEQQKST